MTLGIIGAMEEEVAILRDRIGARQEIDVAGSRFYSGKLEGMDVVLLQSGIGKVNAAIGTTLLLDRFHPDAVVNTGSSGGTDEQLNIGDVVISSKVFHHDVDATAFDYVPGQVPGMPAYYKPDPKLVRLAAAVAEKTSEGQRIVHGAIGTGDSFMSDPQKVAQLKKIFPEMKTVEMEAAAIAQTCYQFAVPFLIIRSLSDVAGKKSEISFEQFLKQAARHSADFVIELIKKIRESQQ